MGHACRPSVLEILYEALAERRLSLTFQEGGIAKPVVLTLPAFTLLATTTRRW